MTNSTMPLPRRTVKQKEAEAYEKGKEAGRKELLNELRQQKSETISEYIHNPGGMLVFLPDEVTK